MTHTHDNPNMSSSAKALKALADKAFSDPVSYIFNGYSSNSGHIGWQARTITPSGLPLDIPLGRTIEKARAYLKRVIELNVLYANEAPAAMSPADAGIAAAKADAEAIEREAQAQAEAEAQARYEAPTRKLKAQLAEQADLAAAYVGSPLNRARALMAEIPSPAYDSNPAKVEELSMCFAELEHYGKRFACLEESGTYTGTFTAAQAWLKSYQEARFDRLTELESEERLSRERVADIIPANVLKALSHYGIVSALLDKLSALQAELDDIPAAPQGAPAPVGMSTRAFAEGQPEVIVTTAGGNVEVEAADAAHLYAAQNPEGLYVTVRVLSRYDDEALCLASYRINRSTDGPRVSRVYVHARTAASIAEREALKAERKAQAASIRKAMGRSPRKL